MMIENFKKRLLILGIGLVIVGGLIAVVGYSLSGPSRDAFGAGDGPKWYKTIYIEPKNIIFSFDFRV